MKQVRWATAVFLIFAGTSVSARQDDPQAQENQPPKNSGAGKQTGGEWDTFARQYRAQQAKRTPLVVPACKDLKLIAAAVDRRFDEENDPILATIRGNNQNSNAAKVPDTLPPDFTEWDAQGNPVHTRKRMNGASDTLPTNWDEGLNDPTRPDTLWDRLVDCAHETLSSAQKAKAFRVLAVWESLRADNLQKLYNAARPVKSPQCQNLRQLADRVDGAVKNREQVSNEEVRSVALSLGACADDSEELNPNRKAWEALVARDQMFRWVGLAYNNLLAKVPRETDDNVRREAAEQIHRDAEDNSWQLALSNPSSLVSIGANRSLTGEQLAQIVGHNRALCEQIITVTRMTPSGLALEPGSPDGRKFLAEKYPRMCVLEDSSRVAPGVPRYLLVYANSESAFTGFQPIQRSSSSPVSGSGTTTNAYGYMWNFTFTGTLQTTETVDAPYVLESQSIFLYAYDADGNVVSRRSITASRQVGGDPSYAAGYNTGELLSRLWKNPKRLAESVLKDVRKDSMKYGKK